MTKIYAVVNISRFMTLKFHIQWTRLKLSWQFYIPQYLYLTKINIRSWKLQKLTIVFNFNIVLNFTNSNKIYS